MNYEIMTDTDIKRAAQQHLQGIQDDLENDLMDACMPHDEMDDIEEYITDAFAVGAKWGGRLAILHIFGFPESWWNSEKIDKAALEWACEHPNEPDFTQDRVAAFLAGCEYITKQIQKEK